MARGMTPSPGSPRGNGIDPLDLSIPSRRGSRRRDRRGRGLRGPLMPPGMPATQTRGEKFDDEVLACVEMLERAWASELRKVEFAVEDIPPSEPAPWERGVALGRYFAADPVAGLGHRSVLYRRAIEARTDGPDQLREMIRDVVVEQVASLLGRPPEEIDPGYRP